MRTQQKISNAQGQKVLGLNEPGRSGSRGPEILVKRVPPDDVAFNRRFNRLKRKEKDQVALTTKV